MTHLSLFDQMFKNEINGSLIGEAIRLSNELRAKQAYTEIDYSGKRIDHPAKAGFDIETCDINDIKNWLNDHTIKKSQSLLMFVHRVLAVRFPNEYTLLKNTIDKRFRKEMELIESEAKNDITFFGEVGFQNLVRLDGSLTNLNAKVVNMNNDRVKIIKK